jgi:hypothetical protein
MFGKKMRNLLLILALVGLSGCETLPQPRQVSNGHVSARVPFGYFSHVDDNGWINIGVPEATAGVSIERISNSEEFQKRALGDLELTRNCYPKEWVSVTEITTLGHLKGRGYKEIISEVKNDDEAGYETYFFLVESDGWWMISAVNQCGDKSSWRNILASLRSK